MAGDKTGDGGANNYRTVGTICRTITVQVTFARHFAGQYTLRFALLPLQVARRQPRMRPLARPIPHDTAEATVPPHLHGACMFRDIGVPHDVTF